MVSMMNVSHLESLQGLYSDMHKDVYGFRPRFHSSKEWYSVKFLNRQIDALEQQIQEQIDEEKEYLARCQHDWAGVQLPVNEQDAGDYESYLFDRYEVRA